MSNAFFNGGRKNFKGASSPPSYGPAGKATGCEEIRLELPKALNRWVSWLPHVCQAAWRSWRAPNDRQTAS